MIEKKKKDKRKNKRIQRTPKALKYRSINYAGPQLLIDFELVGFAM